MVQQLTRTDGCQFIHNGSRKRRNKQSSSVHCLLDRRKFSHDSTVTSHECEMSRFASTSSTRVVAPRFKPRFNLDFHFQTNTKATMKTAILASLVASAAAFAPAQSANRATTSVSESKADLEGLAGKLNPNVKFYDPLNLAEQEFWGKSNEATIGWLRQSEIKHGRIAMFAFVGYIVQSNFVFPWAQTLEGAPHPSPDLVPEAQWDAVPDGAKWQIFGVISMLELWDECGGGGAFPHYTNGRQPGKYPPFTLFRDNVHFVLDLYDPFGFNKNMSEETKERRLRAELNNGRLAQLSIFAFLCADKIPGSVPALNDIAIPYAGDPMQPFEGSFSYFHF